jgi:sensor domain CHASE-containing protein
MYEITIGRLIFKYVDSDMIYVLDEDGLTIFQKIYTPKDKKDFEIESMYIYDELQKTFF